MTLRVLVLVAVLLAPGCSWHARKLFKVEEKIGERVKENIQIADESLNAQPEEHKTRQTDVASQAVHDAAVLSGYPLEDQRPLVAGLFSANEKLRKSAEAAWASKRKSDQRLRTVQMHQLRELQNLGAKAESESNQSVLDKFWTGWKAFFGVGLLGGLIYACVIFPPLGVAVWFVLKAVMLWLGRLFPKLVGLIGVVSAKTYDKTVGIVELAKRENAATKYTIEQIASKKFDEDEKALVRARKPVILEKFKEEEQEKLAADVIATKLVEETAETVRVREAKLADITKGTK